MADTMRSVLPKRWRSMGGPPALRHDSRAATDLRSLLLRRRDLNALKTRPRAQVGRANGRYRRLSPVVLLPDESRLNEPIAGAQRGWWRLVFLSPLPSLPDTPPDRCRRDKPSSLPRHSVPVCRPTEPDPLRTRRYRLWCPQQHPRTL